jgi:hypothetical protein
MSFSFLTSRSNQPGGIFDAIAYYFLLLVAFLLPFAVSWNAAAPFLGTKIFLGGLLVLGMVVAFAVSRLQAQSFSVPKTALLGVAWLLPLAYLLSSLFQSNATLSLFGERLQVDSFMYMILATLALTISAVMLSTKERVLGVYLAVLGGGAVLALAELMIFFGRDTLSAMGVLLPSISLLGSLNDLAVFFGLLAILAVASLTLLPLTTITRVLLWVTLAVSVFFLVTVDLAMLWWIVGLFALAFLVYSVSGLGSGDKLGQRLSISSLFLVALSVLFVLGGDALTSTFAEWANVGELDVRPSWQTTISIGQSAYGESPIFGAGPGTFSKLWSQYRPLEVDQTPFWNANFSFGIGLIPTSFITTGLLGVLAWVVFLVFFVWSGVRVFLLSRAGGHDPVAAYLRISSFVGALFLWIILVVQVPSPALILYTFVLTGLFIASLRFGTGQCLWGVFARNAVCCRCKLSGGARTC